MGSTVRTLLHAKLLISGASIKKWMNLQSLNPPNPKFGKRKKKPPTHWPVAPRLVSPFLAWGDFHARSRFARSTIPEEKWGTTRSLIGRPSRRSFGSSRNPPPH